MNDPLGFAKFVPGFEFMQGLVKNAGAALPNMGQWVAPTLDPEELEKRIEELKAIQFWLEQNARLLGTTIQALEVQRMTLSTLKTMNVQMDQLRESMKIEVPEAAPAPASEPAPARTVSEPAPQDEKPAAASAIDPMQWWGALTRQFGEIAAAALKDGGATREFGAALEPSDLETAAPKPAAKRGARKASTSKASTGKTAPRKTATRKSAAPRAAK
ncbi:MAG: hypothetical protein JSR59_24045 [Proteobacteria bacterium]|nr:hypothetical protein [Pseudomonadota bacterium]